MNDQKAAWDYLSLKLSILNSIKSSQSTKDKRTKCLLCVHLFTMKAFQFTFNYITADPYQSRLKFVVLMFSCRNNILSNLSGRRIALSPQYWLLTKTSEFISIFYVSPPSAVALLFNLESFPWTQLVINSASVKRNMTMEKE